MDKNAIEQYKREMMKLYGKSTVPAEEVKSVVSEEPVKQPAQITRITEPVQNVQTVPPVPEQVIKERTYEEQHPVSEEIDEVNENAPDDTAYSTDERYPEPDLSELNIGKKPEVSTPGNEFNDDMGTSTGYILVNTRTGENSSPVEGALIMITAISDGRREMIASGLTDESGISPKFAVPAPDLEHSQIPDSVRRPYSLYDISVTAKGFFNARSVDVPVFSGITSVQTFGMIPVPLMMKSNEETVTYINQEPDFPDSNR
ncbi:MAG: carboxypeptidase regulatory-like domain-containing protein [Ruminococcus sp.]|nr:carboxypeptidase regulatory-like domain-containing protein [Ruminococcus sp.]